MHDSRIADGAEQLEERELIDDASVWPGGRMEGMPSQPSASPLRQQACESLGDVAVDLLKLLEAFASRPVAGGR
jgi:hypothetical protein